MTAFLMNLAEQFRLQRKVAKHTRNLHRIEHALERKTKNISNIQKIFSKKETQLTSMTSIWQNQANQMIEQRFGLTNGMNNGFNMGSLFNGLSSMMMSAAQQICGAQGSKMDFKTFQDMMTAQQSGQLTQTDTGTTDSDGNKIYQYGNYTQDQYNIFRSVYQGAQNVQQQMTQMAQQMKQEAQLWINNQVEAMKEQLEEQQAMMLLPLQEEETDLKSDQTTEQAQLELAKNALDAVKPEVQQGAKDATVKFGLG